MSGIDYSRALAPTRADWLQYRDQLCSIHSFSRVQAGQVLHTILGPCPPAPPPKEFRKGGRPLVWVGDAAWVHIPGVVLTPDEAIAMADALREHADYARKQEETP